MHSCSTSANNLLQRSINVKPSNDNNTSSSENVYEEESEVERDQVSSEIQSSTEALTHFEGERRGRIRESMLSRFNRYAGSFRVKLSKENRSKLDDLESEER